MKMAARLGGTFFAATFFFFAAGGLGGRADNASDEKILKSVALSLRQGKIKEAMALCAQTSGSSQPSASLLALCGLALLDGGEFEKAQRKFEAACQVEPRCPEAKLGWGELEMSRMRWEEALPLLRQAQTTNLVLYRAVTALSRCLRELGQRQEALSFLRQLQGKVSTLNEREVKGLRQLVDYGDALSRLGQVHILDLDHVAPKTQLTFTAHEGHILIPITLNGLQVRGHVDIGNTGALAIDKKTAAALKIEALTQETMAGIQGESTAKVGLMDKVQIGDTTISHVPVVLADSCLGGAAEANLGLRLLGRFNLTIDYRNKRIVFHRRPPSPGQPLLAARPAGVIPFRLNPLIIIRAKVNGRPEIPCILDTGSGVPLIHIDYYLESLSKGTKSAAMPTRKKGLPYFIQTLELGDLTFRNIFSAILDFGPVFETGSFYIPAIVGASVLQNSVIHLDFDNLNLIIEK